MCVKVCLWWTKSPWPWLLKSKILSSLLALLSYMLASFGRYMSFNVWVGRQEGKPARALWCQKVGMGWSRASSNFQQCTYQANARSLTIQSIILKCVHPYGFGCVFTPEQLTFSPSHWLRNSCIGIFCDILKGRPLSLTSSSSRSAQAGNFNCFETWWD